MCSRLSTADLVNLGTPFNIITLDRQQFLQDVGGTISLQRPNFHLTEALAAEAVLYHREAVV